jgi:hypothetical protein
MPLLLLVVFSLVAGGVAAQEASPVASPDAATPTDASFELALLPLYPDEVGEGFGLWTGRRLTLEDVDVLAVELDRDPIQLRDTLADLGWRRRHSLTVRRPEPGPIGPELKPQTSVSSSVTEYGTTDGAVAGFDLLETETDPDQVDVPGTRTIGDRSEITRFEGTSWGQGYQALALSFQVGRFVGGVTLHEFLGAPDVAQVETLADRLLTKIGAAAGQRSPGLSERVVRLGGPLQVVGINDSYTRLDGQWFLFYSEPVEVTAAAEVANADAIDSYNTLYYLAADSDDGAYFSTNLLRFDNPDAASTWLREAEARFALPSIFTSSGEVEPYSDFARVADAPQLGEESLAFSYTTTDTLGQEGLTSRGYLIVVRVGEEVAEVDLNAVPEVPWVAAFELGAAQTACMTAGGCTETMAPPASLAALADDDPVATPVVRLPPP